MHELDGKVAVVTGAASGIGAGLCRALVGRGANVVAADIEAGALARVVEALGPRAAAHATDVSDAASVTDLARRVHQEHRAVDLCFANAGVFAGGLLWESRDADWDWVLGVNVRGIAHAIREFIPPMLTRAEGGHFVITASLAGVISAPLSGIYCTSKFAAVALAECLHHDLSLQPHGADIRVSCVVPSAVRTGIADSTRNRTGGAPLASPTESSRLVTDALAQATAAGIDPDEAAERILDQVLAGDFYVTTSSSYDRLVAVHNETRQRHAPPQLLMYD